MWYQRSWHFFKTLTRAETSHFLLCKERHYLPWLLTAGCLNQNQEGGGSGSSRDGSGWRQRKACVFVHVLVPQKGKWFFWVWFLAELLFGGGGYGEQITMNTLQVAKVWGKGTMTGLYFPACLCNFIINVSESSFYCLRLSIWVGTYPVITMIISIEVQSWILFGSCLFCWCFECLALICARILLSWIEIKLLFTK